MKYLPRILDERLELELRAFGGVLINGPKWCGKTTTAMKKAKSVLFMQSSTNQASNIQLAEIEPSLLLAGEKPRLIDEWQMAPSLWDAIRHDIDLQSREGLYILTGSTSVDESKIMHSGTGRISRLKMYTLSLFESGDSTGEISLKDLFDQADIKGISDKGILDYATFIVRGGWPRTIGQPEEVWTRQIAGYCDSLIKLDISTVDNISRDERRTQALLRAYARHVGTPVSTQTILNDVLAETQISINTVTDYLNALRRLFVIEDLDAWSPQLRSKTTIRQSAIRHYIDPAIGAHFMNANPRDLVFDVKTMGFLFESMVIRDLRIYSQKLYGKIFHYRDKSGLEADAIIHLDDGRWGAIEVKLGANQVEEAAARLLALKEKIDTEKMNQPSCLVVVTGSQYAYRRKDGVYVVPIGLLGP